ncbi:MAG: hypothetical protein KJI69_01280 [Patescibacteria group bacterium]|nr:hypothetical protein [Patescibacteria group bacterium]
MVFGLFEKHCPVCGMEVNKEDAILRFDKYLCSEECAEGWRKKLAQEESKAAKSGNCCG